MSHLIDTTHVIGTTHLIDKIHLIGMLHLIDMSHLIDRSDDEFMAGLTSKVGFFPAFQFLNHISSLMDVFTPGAGKASSSSIMVQAVLSL